MLVFEKVQPSDHEKGACLVLKMEHLSVHEKDSLLSEKLETQLELLKALLMVLQMGTPRAHNCHMLQDKTYQSFLLQEYFDCST